MPKWSLGGALRSVVCRPWGRDDGSLTRTCIRWQMLLISRGLRVAGARSQHPVSPSRQQSGDQPPGPWPARPDVCIPGHVRTPSLAPTSRDVAPAQYCAERRDPRTLRRTTCGRPVRPSLNGSPGRRQGGSGLPDYAKKPVHWNRSSDCLVRDAATVGSGTHLSEA